MVVQNHSRIAEFGDFQTPRRLAARVCEMLSESGVQPTSIVEPTCGIGNFLLAAVAAFPQANRAVGVDINPRYVSQAQTRAQSELRTVDLVEGDFFATQWQQVLGACNDPILVIGNPPWVTNTHLSKLGSANAPTKSNDSGMSGYDAISGKSNFDISEWMLIRLLDWLSGRNGVLAMLCKTSVARKVLMHAWDSGVEIDSASMHTIDAREHFGVSVDACLLVITLVSGSRCDECSVYSDLSYRNLERKIGYHDGCLIASMDDYFQWRSLLGPERYRWRSGVKHDCSDVMELRRTVCGYTNGLNERVDVEDDYVFPLLKSSDVANKRVGKPKRYVLVPQRKVGDDTRVIQRLAPRTWRYLENHAARLDARKSTIYTRQPRFAVFGVGDYTFAPWKVAVSGLYKQLSFRVVPPHDGKPSLLDDTCYFVACHSETEAEYIVSLLDSTPAREFYRAFLFPDSKRPVTVELLRRLDFLALARVLGSEAQLEEFLSHRSNAGMYGAQRVAVQGALFT